MSSSGIGANSPSNKIVNYSEEKNDSSGDDITKEKSIKKRIKANFARNSALDSPASPSISKSVGEVQSSESEALSQEDDRYNTDQYKESLDYDGILEGPDGTLITLIVSDDGVSVFIKVTVNDDGSVSDELGNKLVLDQVTNHYRQPEGSSSVTQVVILEEEVNSIFDPTEQSDIQIQFSDDAIPPAENPPADGANVTDLLSFKERSENKFKQTIAYAFSSGVNFGIRALVLRGANEGFGKFTEAEDEATQEALEILASTVAAALSGVVLGAIHTSMDKLIKGGINTASGHQAYEMIDVSPEAMQSHVNMVHKKFIGSFMLGKGTNGAFQAASGIEYSWLAKAGFDAISSAASAGLAGLLIEIYQASHESIYRPLGKLQPTENEALDGVRVCDKAKSVCEAAIDIIGQKEKQKMIAGPIASALSVLAATGGSALGKLAHPALGGVLGGAAGTATFLALWFRLPILHKTYCGNSGVVNSRDLEMFENGSGQVSSSSLDESFGNNEEKKLVSSSEESDDEK
ncbi:MAG: hypothetical protein V7776_22315 [Halopseudomonas aestusnigri]